jgi:hypothetical protein
MPGGNLLRGLQLVGAVLLQAFNRFGLFQPRRPALELVKYLTGSQGMPEFIFHRFTSLHLNKKQKRPAQINAMVLPFF